jgi:hypothetical protein
LDRHGPAIVKKDRGNSPANSKPDDTRFQAWRPLAEAGSLLETVLRVSARRPRTPLGQSDLNCAEALLMCPRLMEAEPQELRPEPFRMPGIGQRVPLGEESGSAEICRWSYVVSEFVSGADGTQRTVVELCSGIGGFDYREVGG